VAELNGAYRITAVKAAARRARDKLVLPVLLALRDGPDRDR
jgi:hypothetical protein